MIPMTIGGPENLLEIHRRLCQLYGCPVAYFGNRDPLSQLISSLLSQRTTNKNKSISFKALVAAFPTWEDVRDAPLDRIQDAIRAATWPEQKAPRIQEVLRVITERAGSLSLDFLGDMAVEAARTWLEALPVDAHHYRVAVRLGLLPANASQAKAHVILESQLPADWTPQDYYDHHEVMMFHGQKCCYFKTPACERCVLLELCPTGRSRVLENEE